MTDAEFREAFRAHKDVVFRFAYRMTGCYSASEDVVQDCFVAFWRKPSGYDATRGELRAFLLGIARKKVLKSWRDQRPHEALEADSAVCAPLDIENLERREAIERAVQALPPLQREAVVLADFEELSLDEICRATGAELAAVKSRIHRARENLRGMLMPLYSERCRL